MRVNPGCGDMAMAKALLDRADIVAVFKKLRRETVSQRVGGSMLRDLRPLNCFLYRFLNHRLVDVVSPLHAGIRSKYLLLAGNPNSHPHCESALGYLRAIASGSVVR